MSVLSTHIMSVETQDKIESTLKKQLFISTILLLGFIYTAALASYPSDFRLKGVTAENESVGPWAPYVCSIIGLVSGMVIAVFT